MIHIIVVKNPFDVRCREDFYEEWTGKQLKDLVETHGPKAYSINGILAKGTDIPKDGDEAVIMPKIEKKAFGWILTIGITILSANIAGGVAFAAHWGLWAKIGASLALTMLGNYVASKLTPTPKVDVSNTEQSNTYGWGEMQSLTGQGQVLPVVYGTVKTAGMMLQRHVISDGTKQYLNVLYCLAEGPIDSIENIKVNGNKIENFKDIQVDRRNGNASQSVIPNFNDSYADQALAYELNNDSQWHTVTLEGNTAQGIEITVSFPQGLYYSNDQGNPDWTGVTLEAQYRKKGSSDWQKIPIRNENYEWEPEWAKNKSRHSWLTNMTWKSHYYDDCRTLVGYETYTRRGHTYYKHDEDGDRIPIYKYSMTYDEWKNQLISSHMYDGIIRQKETSAFYRVWGIQDLEPAQYEVRMRCTQKDNTSIRCANKIQWSGVTQIIYDDFCYPGKALLGMKALATDQLSGGDPQMTCEVTRSTIYAWNPDTNQYEEKAANNPAWACYDILHHCVKYGSVYEVYGVPKENMDYYAFEAWANNCDSEKIEFNYLFDSAMQVNDALIYPARVGKGAVLIIGTKYSCIYDYPEEPSQLFTVANIKKGSFKEEFQAITDRANAMEISFMNKDKDYERDVITVFDSSYDLADTCTQPTQIELMGCTSTEQAYKFGKYKLRANKYEIRTISFEAWTDAIACTIGQVIMVQHDITNWGNGGRVKKVEGNIITLDQELPDDYTDIMVRENKTNEICYAQIQKIDGYRVTVSNANGFTEDAVYAAGRTGRSAKQFKVISIEKNMNEETREITATEYYPEIYNPDTDVVPDLIPYDNKVDAPTNLILTTESYTEADGTITNLIHCTWRNPRTLNTVVMEVSIGGNNYSFESKFESGESSYTFRALSNQYYFVRLYAQNEFGIKSSYCTNNIYTDGKDNPPPDVESINVEKMASGLRRYWWKFSYPYPNDIAGFRIKYAQGKELNWANGTQVQEGLVTSQPYETQTVRQGTHAVMIKAVDNAGNESTNFAYCILDLGDILEENVLVHKDFKENNWGNVTHNGILLHDGYIHAKSGTYRWPNPNDYAWSKPDDFMWKAHFVNYDAIATFTAAASGQFFLKYDISGPAIVYYRKIMDGSYWSAAEKETPYWKVAAKEGKAWDDTGSFWKQYSDRVMVQRRDMIQIKVHAINSSSEETVIKGLEALIDVPDRNEHFEDIAISKNGTALPIVTPYYKTTAVHLDAIQGTAINFRFISRTPCVIQLIDKNGAAVDGTADVSWQGYEEDI